MVYTLLDIEHIFLRHKSKKASMYGFTIVNSSLKESDPRKPFRLDEPKPFVTFALFNATQETPPFKIFTDPQNLDEDLYRAGEIFVRMYVKARRENYTITLPVCLSSSLRILQVVGTPATLRKTHKSSLSSS